MPTLMTPSRVSLINPLNPAGPRVAAEAWERTTEDKVEGEVKQYAFGRRVSVTYATPVTELKLVLMNLPQADYDTLRSWLGKLTLFRDRHGRKVFGTFLALAVVDFRDTAYDISFDYEPLTYVEDV